MTPTIVLVHGASAEPLRGVADDAAALNPPSQAGAGAMKLAEQ